MRLVACIATLGLFTALPVAAAQAATPAPESAEITMTVDGDSIVPRLADALGYFREEGLAVKEIGILDVSVKDFHVQQPLLDGKVQFAYHWAQHAVFGARHGLPIKSVMTVTDAPGMSVLVHKDAKDEIRSAADFKGRKVAEGAGYAAKSMIMNYLAVQAGLPSHSYDLVAKEVAGREEAVLKGLGDGSIDIVAFMEPLTDQLLSSGHVVELYDLKTRAATEAVLGSSIPCESILMAEEFIEHNPRTAQAVVNAIGKAVRFINTHTPEEIYDALPESYTSRKPRAAEVRAIGLMQPTYAKESFATRAEDMARLVDMVQSYDFDASEAGVWRATSQVESLSPQALYDNRFAEGLSPR